PSGPRRTPIVAPRFRRALVAAREQRRKRWQIWGHRRGLAIIAATWGVTPRRVKSRASRRVRTIAIERQERTRAAPPRSPPRLAPWALQGKGPQRSAPGGRRA